MAIPVCDPKSKDEQQSDHLRVGFEMGLVFKEERLSWVRSPKQ